MFGSHPRIPIDIIFPNTKPFNVNRPESKQVEFSEIKDLFDTDLGNLNTIDILDDITEEEILNGEQNIQDALKVVKAMKDRLRKNFEVITRNKNIKMSNAIKHHNRKYKRLEYEVGDTVLCNHPKLKKVLSRGLAPRFYGPFRIIGKSKNCQDYILKRMNSNKGRTKMVHRNNLRKYFEKGSDLNNNNNSGEEENLDISEQSIRQDRNNNLEFIQENLEEMEMDEGDQLDLEDQEAVGMPLQSERQVENQPRKRGRKRKSQQLREVVDNGDGKYENLPDSGHGDSVPVVTRGGRVSKPVQRYQA